jgi:hypothetical protein
MFVSYFTMINLIHFPPVNSEFGNSAYCFKQAWNEGGKMKFGIAQWNGTTVRSTLEDNTSVMIAGSESNEKLIHIPPDSGI